jgi:uncharacterized membrane protein YozB (DUF420 family)
VIADFDFPKFNASLNSLCAILLVLGYLAIRGKQVKFHVACMLTALVLSAVFLGSYLYYHIAIKGGQPTRFPTSAPAEVRWTYYVILISHTILAIVATPLALVTAWLGYRGRLGTHVRVARWTLPIWLYVSVTGVVVYWMLYRLYPAP